MPCFDMFPTATVRKVVTILGIIMLTLPLMADMRKPVERVAPIYPELARRMHVGGVVKILCSVNAKGKVTNVKVISGPALLAGAAESAVMFWKFEPSDGPTEETVDLVFNISE